MSGVKFDQDKPRMELLDQQALEGLAKVLTFGAKKYAAHNWRGGLTYSRLLGAALRHTFAILRGEDIDPESGLPHVDHLGCCWMFLSNMMKTRPDLDDRWKDKDVADKERIERVGKDFRAVAERLPESCKEDPLADSRLHIRPTEPSRGGWRAIGGDSQSPPPCATSGNPDDQKGVR